MPQPPRACRARASRARAIFASSKILGDWAYLRNYLQITVTPPGGQPVKRAGYTLTIVRKQPDGTWRLARDANLLAART